MERCRGAPLTLFHSCRLCFLLPCLLLLLHCSAANAYKNYTVGDSLGWYDDLEVPKVDYQKWAEAKNFSLGDFLFFNTDKNHSVIQTYNATTYKRCDDSEDADAIDWSTGMPDFSKDAVTVAVPLLKEGPTYFFSNDYDGEQCQHGQRFQVNVTHGEGLPDSLKSPSEMAPGPANPDAVNDVPDTVIPSNFDHPLDTTPPVKPSAGAGESLARLCREAGAMNLAVMLLSFLVVSG